MNKYVLLITLLLLPAYLVAAECTKQEAIKAETTAAYIKSWKNLEDHYSNYRHCDDGAIAEGYSESVSFLMENKWLAFLNYKMEKPFYNFVKKHVDKTWKIDRFIKVNELASSNCNKSKETICEAILNVNHNDL